MANNLSLYYPVKPLSVNQVFGNDPTYYKKFGLNGHNGVDLMAYHGQPVYAAHDGVAYYEVDENQGDGFVIRTNGQFDYQGTPVYFKSIYWHLCSASDPKFKPIIPTDGKGYPVKAGDLIGYADNTGAPYESSGDHLHFGLKPQAQGGEPDYTWYNYAQSNGFLGAIDPTPYFNGLYAQDINTTYVFSIDMQVGDSGEEVRQLQLKLQRLGYFPSSQEATGYYGSITRGAVFAFQNDFVNLSWIAKVVYRGRYCSQLTRTALNAH